VRFDYERADDNDRERIVDPLGLVARGNAWYLVADKGEQRRTYRVSRIAAAALLDEPCRRPGGFDLAEHWERTAREFREKLPSYRATFLADAKIMGWVRWRSRTIEEEVRDGDRIRIRVRFDVAEEALHFALAFGAAIEVVEPAELRTRVLEAATALVERYRDAASALGGAPTGDAAPARDAVRAIDDTPVREAAPARGATVSPARPARAAARRGR
jgi:predicted DNA-binding transcriptional regulator YafY